MRKRQRWKSRNASFCCNCRICPHVDAPVGEDASANPVVRTGVKCRSFLSRRRAMWKSVKSTRCSTSSGGEDHRQRLCLLHRGGGAARAGAAQLPPRSAHAGAWLYRSEPAVSRAAEALIGTSQLPKFADQLYRCADDDVYLAPTAEVPVTNLHREEILTLKDLPKKYVAYTPCFRREAGSAGLGTRGLIRMHQFDKVELVKITTPENSAAEWRRSRRCREGAAAPRAALSGDRTLHGDIGLGSAKTYDIEVWAPGQNAYLEVSSCSNFGDFQARRMALRYQRRRRQESVLPHAERLGHCAAAAVRCFARDVPAGETARSSTGSASHGFRRGSDRLKALPCLRSCEIQISRR
jgi:seryl-tRNA synthetase